VGLLTAHTTNDQVRLEEFFVGRLVGVFLLVRYESWVNSGRFDLKVEGWNENENEES
jgi:hypothetical protein